MWKLRPTLCDPMDYTVRGILQARILDWVTFPFSWGSSQPSDWTKFSCTTGGFFTSWATREAEESWSGSPFPSPADLPDPGIEPGPPASQADSLPSEPGRLLESIWKRALKCTYPKSTPKQYPHHKNQSDWQRFIQIFLKNRIQGVLLGKICISTARKTK